MSKVVEILGLSGSGKSTLVAMLCDMHGCSVSSRLPRWRTMPIMASVVVRYLVPFLVYSRLPLLRQNMKLVVYIHAMLHHLRTTRRGDGVVLLDQGMIFALASLCRDGFSAHGRLFAARFRQRMVSKCLGGVDGLVYLSVEKETGIDRVLRREKAHRLKTMTADQQQEFWTYYEDFYAAVTAQARHMSLPVQEVDTTQEGIPEAASTVARFLATLGKE